jgi:alpha-mannosidase
MPYTMYLDQSAHLDWDWLDRFEGYYAQGYEGGASVREVLSQALDNLKRFNTGGQAPYYYSICEMGYLFRFVSEDASRVKTIEAAGDNFQVVGGGITSPDALVCSGEGFLRNYLVGRVRLAEVLPGLQAKPYCVIPDDFGQGPELPVLLQALGFPALVFGRLPGTFGPNRPEPMAQLKQHGVDFVWRAADGSEVVAHWMLSQDGTGNYAYANPGPGQLQPIADLVSTYQAAGAPGTYPAAATPFMYFSVENDFSLPVDGLLAAIEAWNANPPPEHSIVTVRAGTFADFVEMVLPRRDQLQLLAPYNGTPYWTGYYASRPALKTLHYGALRMLQEAEVFGLLAPGAVSGTFGSELADTWVNFAPSTHHDFICGTANDEVYQGEQLPLLTQTAQSANSLREAALGAIAGGASPVGGVPVVVANGLGFSRTDLAELPAAEGPVDSACVQPSFEGGTLFLAEVPSFGFTALDLAAGGERAQPALASIDPGTSGAESYTLENEFMRATISQAAGWGIESLVDSATGRDLLEGPGNELVFYSDGGDIYRFGNEVGDLFSADSGVAITTSGPGLGAVVLETGPLRARLRTTVRAAAGDGSASAEFTREYALVAGEPFLRMATTGAAFPVEGPPGYSVMTRFPLASPIESIGHGTGGHWTDVPPLSGFWAPPVFQATHDFVLPREAGGAALAAVYHDGMPAWAFDEDGALLGCLLRNTPGDNYGASGTDTDPHTHLYALRVPSGLAEPESGQPLREARRFTTPPLARAVPKGGTGASSSGSVAAASDPAILTVAKPGTFNPNSLVLRLYQPTNAPARVQVTLGAPPETMAARVTTALEGEWTGPPMPLIPDASGFALEMPAALATVQVGASP